MKIRNDFVTNSSSSSFVISKKFLSDDQIDAILNNFYYTAKELNLENSEYAFEWSIYDRGTTIEGYTVMDNFDANDLFKAINLPMGAILEMEYD